MWPLECAQFVSLGNTSEFTWFTLLNYHAVLFTVHTCTSAAYSSDSLCLCALSELHVITALCSEILTKVVHAIICHKSPEREEDQKEC